jgi:hypothetical protein
MSKTIQFDGHERGYCDYFRAEARSTDVRRDVSTGSEGRTEQVAEQANAL